MADRPSLFADDLRKFVDEPRDDALKLAQAPAAPKPSGLKWRLGSVAELKDEANADPVVLRASEWINGTLAGQNLISELKKRIKKQPPITVEVFATGEALADRQQELAGVAHSEGQGLHGFTQPVSLKPLSTSADFDELEPNLHFIVGVRTPSERSVADLKKEEDFLKFSDPVRSLSMAEALFHEFLHASIIAATARKELGIQQQFLVPNVTGHGGDTSFDIDPFSLQLIIEGQVDASFKQRLVAFVKEVVDTFQLKKKLEAERAQFKKLQKK
jgi:hypothetical protein